MTLICTSLSVWFRAISSHLQTCGCSIVVGSNAEKVNKVTLAARHADKICIISTEIKCFDKYCCSEVNETLLHRSAWNCLCQCFCPFGLSGSYCRSTVSQAGVILYVKSCKVLKREHISELKEETVNRREKWYCTSHAVYSRLQLKATANSLPNEYQKLLICIFIGLRPEFSTN